LTRRGPGERVRGQETAVVLGRDGGLPVSARIAPAVYDGPVTTLRRLAADPLVPILVLTLAVVAIGCAGPAATPSVATARPVPSPSAVASTSAPSLTPVPGGGATPVGGASIGPPGTTNVTGFGRILDALPPSFPKLPGQEAADTGAGPTSGSVVANLDVAAASATIQTALQASGWTVDAGSPVEDGSVVLEASGPNACKAEIRFTPQTGSVIMTVLYGATCPYP
jgi:hypothetical protein